MADYVPIACIEHEKLEFAVLRRHKLRLEYLDENGLRQTIIALPTDVQTRQGAEWLSYRTAEEENGVIRLDRIVTAVPIR